MTKICLIICCGSSDLNDLNKSVSREKSCNIGIYVIAFRYIKLHFNVADFYPKPLTFTMEHNGLRALPKGPTVEIWWSTSNLQCSDLYPSILIMKPSLPQCNATFVDYEM